MEGSDCARRGVGDAIRNKTRAPASRTGDLGRARRYDAPSILQAIAILASLVQRTSEWTD